MDPGRRGRAAPRPEEAPGGLARRGGLDDHGAARQAAGEVDRVGERPPFLVGAHVHLRDRRLVRCAGACQPCVELRRVGVALDDLHLEAGGHRRVQHPEAVHPPDAIRVGDHDVQRGGPVVRHADVADGGREERLGEPAQPDDEDRALGGRRMAPDEGGRAVVEEAGEAQRRVGAARDRHTLVEGGRQVGILELDDRRQTARDARQGRGRRGGDLDARLVAPRRDDEPSRAPQPAAAQHGGRRGVAHDDRRTQRACRPDAIRIRVGLDRHDAVALRQQRLDGPRPPPPEPAHDRVVARAVRADLLDAPRIEREARAHRDDDRRDRGEESRRVQGRGHGIRVRPAQHEEAEGVVRGLERGVLPPAGRPGLAEADEAEDDRHDRERQGGHPPVGPCLQGPPPSARPDPAGAHGAGTGDGTRKRQAGLF